MPKGKFHNKLICVQKQEDPVIDVLLGLPDSVLDQLDTYAAHTRTTRSAAVGLLLQQVRCAEQQEKMLAQLKVVQAAHKSRNPQRRRKDRSQWRKSPRRT
mgnify:CR=1 FL=1